MPGVRSEIERVTAGGVGAEDVFRGAAAVLSQVVPFDGWCGVTLDPATLINTGAVHESTVPSSLLARLVEIEYREQDVTLFADLARRHSPAAALHQATGGRPERSPRFREVIAPGGYGQELRLVLRDRGQAWGGFVFLRTEDAPTFTPAEQDLLASLSGSLAIGLRRSLLRAEVTRGALPNRSGLVLLDENYQVTSMTPSARRALGSEPGARLPDPVYAVAARAQGSVEGASARAWFAASGWLTLYGWQLESTQVAVSVEPTRPEQLASLALDAYGLSAREREVTQLVLLGNSTNEIARRLFLSPYTVQDHLKAVFDKTGARSRRSLVAELFFRHYQPRLDVSGTVDDRP